MPSSLIPQGDEYQVNTHTDDVQNRPVTTALADGGYVIVWDSKEQDAPTEQGYGVYGQRYTANGEKIDGEFLINTTTTNTQGSASVAALADGGFIVTWDSKDQDNPDDAEDTDYGIYGQRFDAAGDTVGGEFQINTFIDGYQGNPSVAALTNGGFVVSWSSRHQDGSSLGVFAQRYNANGNTVGDEFLVTTETDQSQSGTFVTALATGGFLVTWVSSNQDGQNGGIFGQRFKANGDPVGDEFQINTYTPKGQWGPNATALTDGGFVVTWYSEDNDGDSFGVFGQRYNGDGTTAGGEFQINTHSDGRQEKPSVTELPDGGFVVAWWGEDNQDGDFRGVFAQRFDANGNPVGVEFQVNTYTNDIQDTVSIDTLADGSIVMTWSSRYQDGSDRGIYSQKFAIGISGTEGDDLMEDIDGVGFMNGLGGDNTLLGLAGRDSLFGGEGNDIIKGGKGKDNLHGDGGDDFLKGGKGGDYLFGGAGNDIIKGGKGADIINGGAGDDLLYGNSGRDVFVFAANDGSDVIFDFKNGKDKFDLSAFGFDKKSDAKAHFFEKGSAKNDVVGFSFEGTEIKIKGLDLGDINGADFII